jgi:hypothetical protein
MPPCLVTATIMGCVGGGVYDVQRCVTKWQAVHTGHNNWRTRVQYPRLNCKEACHKVTENLRLTDVGRNRVSLQISRHFNIRVLLHRIWRDSMLHMVTTISNGLMFSVQCRTICVKLRPVTDPSSNPHTIHRWIWSNSKMILTGENLRTYRKPCLYTNFPTSRPDLNANQGLGGVKPAT